MTSKQATSGGGVFFLCLVLGIVFGNVALGIIAGLILGGGTAKVTAGR